MKLTNKFNYHETVVRAIRNDTYSRGDSEFSATGLIQPARIRVLTERHKEEIESDVDDEVFKLYGHMGHSLLERAGEHGSLNHLTEERFFGEVDGVRISAQIDSLSLDGGCLTDWKFTTVYGFMRGEKPKPEWVWQMNIQLELLRQNHMDAKELKIVGLLRDWRPGEAANNPDYPTKISTHTIPMLTREKTREYISYRIKLHKEAEIDLPKCTDKENWSRRRCRNYCQVSRFCVQYQDWGKE